MQVNCCCTTYEKKAASEYEVHHGLLFLQLTEFDV